MKATQGKSGFNVTGYRDYRGVPVYGAWLWDDKLDMARSLTVAPFCDELIRLADDFDFDGIQKLVLELDG